MKRVEANVERKNMKETYRVIFLFNLIPEAYPSIISLTAVAIWRIKNLQNKQTNKKWN